MRAKRRRAVFGVVAVLLIAVGAWTLVEDVPSTMIRRTRSGPAATDPVAFTSPTRAAPSRSRSSTPVPPVDAPVAVVVRQLLPMRDRSPQATCRLAAELTRCAMAEKALRIGLEMRARALPQDRADVEKTIADLDRHSQDCRALSAAEIDQAYALQREAFAVGPPRVQRWVLERLLPEEGAESARDESPARQTENRRLYEAFARRALARRDMADLSALMRLYSRGRWSDYTGALGPNDALELALVDVATRFGTPVPIFVSEAASKIPRTPALNAEVDRLTAELLSKPWQPIAKESPQAASPDPYAELWGIVPADCDFPDSATRGG